MASQKAETEKAKLYNNTASILRFCMLAVLAALAAGYLSFRLAHIMPELAENNPHGVNVAWLSELLANLGTELFGIIVIIILYDTSRDARARFERDQRLEADKALRDHLDEKLKVATEAMHTENESLQKSAKDLEQNMSVLYESINTLQAEIRVLNLKLERSTPANENDTDPSNTQGVS